MAELTLARLREVLHYDSETGRFTRFVGKKKVGNVDTHGHIQIEIDDKAYLAHRLAWLWMTGSFPYYGWEVHHINNIKQDNRWKNLHIVTHTEHTRHHNYHKTNTSGTTGVWWHKRAQRWYVRLWGENLGSFTDKQDAVRVARRFLRLRHMDFE